MKEDEREEKLAGWEKAVKYSFGWAKINISCKTKN